MTLLETALAPAGRTAIPRRYLMCRPEHFAVEYAINPWMDPTQPVDRRLAARQWERLVATYRGLGHQVELADAGYRPVPVDLSELLRAGGSVKCCTMELRA